jgi:hydroxyacylglutathione hydrolase
MERFIEKRRTESPYLPPYFRKMEIYNQAGAPAIHSELSPRPLTISEVNEFRKAGCQLIDIRAPTSFGAGHIPGSLSIWRDGISSFLGWFADYERPVILIDDFNQNLDEVYRQCIRLGYDNTAGFLGVGFPGWTKAAQDIGTIATCSVQQLAERMNSGPLYILDVRDIRNRRAVGFIPGSEHMYAGEVPLHANKIPSDVPVYLYCDAGYKGSLAASYLAAHDFSDVTNVLGGMTAWIQAGFRIER